MSPVLFREHKATFGPYLRELRVARGVSLRDAARRLGITFTKLQKMETGGRFRIASAGMFERLEHAERGRRKARMEASKEE